MWRVLLVLVSLLLCGCQSTSLIPLRTQINASHTLNAQHPMESLPVELVIYELTELDKFNKSSFDALWLHDKSSLADDLIRKRSMTLTPGQKESLMLALDRRTQYIGIVGFFRQPSYAWRKTIKKPSAILSLISPVNIMVRGNRLRIVS